MNPTPPWKRLTWPDFFCLLGLHEFVYESLEYAGDGKQVVKTKCVNCPAVDYGSEVVGLRIERKGKSR